MDSEGKLKQQIANVAKSFFSDHMSMKVESIEVDIHSDSVVVTLGRGFPQAETAYAQDALSCDRLEKFYRDSYGASKRVFETALGKVYPHHITGSCMSTHPALGKCVIIVSVRSDKAKQAQLG